MAVSAMVAIAATVVGSAGYSVATSQSSMQSAHGAQNKADAEKAQMQSALTAPKEAEAQAQRASQQRRKDYANMGRSSTIMTGPGGLSSSAQPVQKTLLGT